MGIPRWRLLGRDTPLPDVIAALREFFVASDSNLVGGDRAKRALDNTDTLVTAVDDAATIAGKPAAGVAAAFATVWMETFDTLPDWQVLSGSAQGQTLVATGQTGGMALRQVGTVSQSFRFKVPFDPSKRYRFRARVKRVSGSGTFTYGVRCLDAAGAVTATLAVCAAAVLPSVGSYGAEITGWVQGYGSFTGASDDASTPAKLPAGTAWVEPYVVLNGGDGAGVTDVDYLDYDRQDEEASARAYTTLLPSDDAQRLATGAGLIDNTVHTAAVQNNAVTEPKHADDSVSTRVIQTDVVITGRVENAGATAFIDLRTTLAPGSIIVQLPGFTADNLGNATFDGEVAATSFTAALATFTFDVGVTGNLSVGGTFNCGGTALFTNDITASGGVVLFLSGFQASSAAITSCTVGGTFQHNGSAFGVLGTTAVAKHANISDTSGADLATLEGEVNAIKALLRYYGFM